MKKLDKNHGKIQDDKLSNDSDLYWSAMDELVTKHMSMKYCPKRAARNGLAEKVASSTEEPPASVLTEVVKRERMLPVVHEHSTQHIRNEIHASNGFRELSAVGLY